jgi:RNA polymerase sigma factor (sigma-70 family)
MINAGGNILMVWESFKLGNKEAFAYLYNLHVDPLFRYGTKLCKDEGLVKDSIQEVFLDLYLKREKNKTNPENLKYYLILALKRSLIKKLKRNRRFVEGDTAGNHGFEPEYSIEKIIIEQEQEQEINRRVVKSLSLLPAKQKETLYLRFNEALEYNEISQILNISIESARKQVYRALKTLRQSFKTDSIIFMLLFNKKNNS